MRNILIGLSLLCWSTSGYAQNATTSDSPLSERLVSYTMDVNLDPDTKTVAGTQIITWRNTDDVPVSELQFHMYLNAFQDSMSTFMIESGGRHRGFSASGDDVWGGVTVNSMKRLAGVPRDEMRLGGTVEEDLTGKLEFIQPDDSNVNDQTVMRVHLDRPVGPGETVALEVDFESKLPKIVARTGWEESGDGRPFFFVAQWFPKLGVYELPGQRYHPADASSGKWSTHQFHANSEFYADFGTYDVSITVPDGYKVGASGVQTAEANADGTSTFNFRAEDVHDFAWTASESFIEYTDTWEHVNLRLLLQPEHDGQQDRHFLAAKNALEGFSDWVGEYPYTTLTLIDGIGGSNGMEYPTLITCGTFYGIPSWVRVPLELVTIHEFGHQYFYGLLANNEAEEAWLDEGMNSYLETKIMDHYYDGGSVIDFPGLPVDDAQMQRLSYTKSSPSRGALFTKSWEYNPGDYGRSSYAKPATVMNTLERYLGWDVMQAFLKEYFQRWSFDHPTTRDLQQVAEDVSGEDLDWFFDQYVYGTATVDYEVDRIENTLIEGSNVASSDSSRFDGTVMVHRKYDGYFPLTLQVRYRDGTLERIAIDGRDEWLEVKFTDHAGIVEAFIDPDDDVRLDLNRLNNRQLVSGDPGPFSRKVHLKATVILQQLFFSLAGLF